MGILTLALTLIQTQTETLTVIHVVIALSDIKASSLKALALLQTKRIYCGLFKFFFYLRKIIRSNESTLIACQSRTFKCFTRI